MDTYYDIAERIMNVTSQYAKGSALTEILLNRLQLGGFPESSYMPLAADLKPTDFGMVHSDVFFSSISLLSKASYIRPFDLAVNACAVQVLVDQGKVTGVKVMSPDHRSYLLKAKTVVLSASTYETPRLLLHSGIQGKAIGRYMTNQVFMMAPGKVKRKDFPEVLGTLAILIPPTKERPFQVRLSGPAGYDWYSSHQIRPLVEDTTWDISILCFGHVNPRFENGITLNPHKKDKYGVPENQILFSFTETERANIRQMEEAVKQIASAIGVQLVQDKICLMPTGDLHHTSGTCRMGNDPSTSVTNRYGQVHGVSGLYIADISIIPSLGSENPTLKPSLFPFEQRITLVGCIRKRSGTSRNSTGEDAGVVRRFSIATLRKLIRTESRSATSQLPTCVYTNLTVWSFCKARYRFNQLKTA